MNPSSKKPFSGAARRPDSMALISAFAVENIKRQDGSRHLRAFDPDVRSSAEFGGMHNDR